ncbi:MAG: NUDIX hydrolase [Gaiellaceae bacterium]
MSKGSGSVRAAGGLVGRLVGDELQVLLVHRPRYDDWSFPKGKVQPGEREASCALREVEEETGLRCELGPELGSTAYLDRNGRPKTVLYWAMRPGGGAFEPSREVDEIRWLSPAGALELLSYAHDRNLLAASEPLLGALAAPEGRV